MPDPDLAQRVAATAHRLRLVQADFADDSPEVRAEHLREEIERATGSMVAERRRAFLEMLAERFPSWDSNVRADAEELRPPPRSRADERDLADPSFLVRRLLDLAPSMSEEQRRGLGETLAAVGIGARRPPGGLPPEAAATAAAELGVEGAPGGSVDPARALELLAMLGAMSRRLDQIAWSTWRTIHPRSSVKRAGELQRTMARFATGDQDVPRGQVQQELEALRKLVAAMVASVGRAGGQFAQRLLARLAPTEIEAAVRAGRRVSMLSSVDAECWKEYKQRASALDSSSIETELLESVANIAESLMRGTGR